jgi:hypothetical protein
MTDEERQREGAEEAIEDLEAPGEAQRDVVGGALACRPSPSCGRPSAVCGGEPANTCVATAVACKLNSRSIVVYEQ